MYTEETISGIDIRQLHSRPTIFSLPQFSQMTHTHTKSHTDKGSLLMTNPLLSTVLPRGESLLNYRIFYSYSRRTKKKLRNPCYQIGYCTSGISTGQHLFISASNNMFYRHSQWDKRHTICVVNLMPQDTKIEFLNRSCLQSSGWVSDTLPVCHMCLVQILWNWIYLELNIFLDFIQPVF